MAKTLKEKIKVMEHYENSGTVECRERGCYDWEIDDAPCWNWYDFDYRIISSKQKVTIEKWLIEDISINTKGIKVVIETSDIASWLSYYPKAKKLKLKNTS